MTLNFVLRVNPPDAFGEKVGAANARAQPWAGRVPLAKACSRVRWWMCSSSASRPRPKPPPTPQRNCTPNHHLVATLGGGGPFFPGPKPIHDTPPRGQPTPSTQNPPKFTEDNRKKFPARPLAGPKTDPWHTPHPCAGGRGSLALPKPISHFPARRPADISPTVLGSQENGHKTKQKRETNFYSMPSATSCSSGFLLTSPLGRDLL